MAAATPWTNPAGPLIDLATLLGIDPEQFALNEGVEDLTYDEPYDGSRLSALAAQLDSIFQESIRRYGAAFKFEIVIGPWVVLTVDGSYSRATLQAFFNKHPTLGNVRFVLIIDKTLLLAQWSFTHPSAVFELFLFLSALERALSVPLHELENALLSNATGAHKLIIAVPDHSIALNGDYLAILGGEALDRWNDYLPAPGGVDLVKKASDIHDLAETSLVKWLHFTISRLTPLQLNVDDDGAPAGDPIAGIVYAQLVTCSILYTAVLSSWNDDQWIARFNSEKYLAKFDVPTAPALRQTIVAAAPKAPWEAARDVARLAMWIYDPDRSADRQIMLQNVVASALQDYPSSANCAQLVKMAKELYRRVDGGWATFIGKKLDEYFHHIKELEETIVGATKSYDEQVAALAKALIDNMLAAVAVVVGSFIAAMFKTPFDWHVFQFGAAAYLLYLFAFPIAMGLTSTDERFALSKKTFAWRREKFNDRLTKTTVDRIIGGTVAHAEGCFTRWFWRTAAAYAVIVAALLVAIVLVPDLTKRWSDDFSLRQVAYGPAAGDAVPTIIRGDHFDKEKEIVVTIDGTAFTNAGSDSVKVHGSTVLTLSPQRNVLSRGKTLSVTQGTAGPKTIPLPPPR